jgi:flagellar motor switch protein FliN
MADIAGAGYGMSEEISVGASALGTNPKFRMLLEEAAESLMQVLEAMTDQRPQTSWRAVQGTPAEAGVVPDADFLWWEQHFQFSPEAVVWLGAPRATWEYAGTLALKAAGLEEPPEGEARKTWLEIAGQWFAALARCFASALGSEVLCAGGEEKPDPPGLDEWAVLALTFGEIDLPPLVLTFSKRLLTLLAGSSGEQIAGAPVPGAGAPRAEAAVPSRTLDLLLDVDLPVSISFGKTELPLKDVLKLTTGSIVELNRAVTDPVEVLVNHCLVARGEVVVVEGNYGVRIQHIVSREDRLRSVR